MILIGLAGLRSQRHSKNLHRLGIFLGACGLLTVVPAVSIPAVAVFALGSVVWFAWWGGILLSGSIASATGSHAPILASLALGGVLLVPQGALAKDWTTQTTKDKRVVVRHRISDVVDAQGVKSTLVEYTSILTESVEYRKCLSLLRDVSRHATIHDDESSRTVRVVSESERIVHYKLKMPWPLPETDCVLRMVVVHDSLNRTATVSLVGAPDEIPMGDSRRIRVYSTIYELKDLGNNRSEITAKVRVQPPFELPAWMLSASFPDAAADPLRMIAKLAAKER